MKHVILLLWLIVLLAVQQGAVAGELTPKMPLQGVKSDAVTYDIDFAVVVTAPYHTKSYHQWGGPHDDVASHIDINGGKMDGFINAMSDHGTHCWIDPTPSSL